MPPIETAGADRPFIEAGDRLDGSVLDGLWDFDRPAVSALRFREQLRQTLVGTVTNAELTTQLARSIGLQGRYEEATGVLDTVGLQDPVAAVVQIRLSLERGRLLNSAGDPPAAVDHVRTAVMTAREAGEDFLEVDAAHMLAIADRDHADEWTTLALHAVSRARDPRTQRGPARCTTRPGGPDTTRAISPRPLRSSRPPWTPIR